MIKGDQQATAGVMSVDDVKPESPDIAISIKGLRKLYSTVEAVKGVDLEILTGEIFGLIGPDGAGKTSIFQILSGVMSQTAGEVTILGSPPRRARPYVGYLTQDFSLYQDLSVRENLRYVGSLRKIPEDEGQRRGERYLSLFNMDSFGDQLAGRLSGGMKQKLALACALIAEPAVLLLDEPTTGVDPVSRREFWDALISLSLEGMTIVVATSYLDEAERCHRVALMHEGLVHRSGTSTDLRRLFGLKRLEVRADDLARSEELLDGLEGVQDVQRFGDRIDLLVKDITSAELAVRRTLELNGVTIKRLRADEPTLENIFVSTLRRSDSEVKTYPVDEYRPCGPGSIGAVAIGARNLRKKFGDFQAVNGVTIEVRYGEIYGLLGANGAGKTTTIKILCSLLAASSGEIELAGEKGKLRRGFVRQRVGYMSQKFSLYDDLTINENLDFFAGVYRVPASVREEKKRRVLSFAGLEGRGDMLTRTLPGGWKQRVAFGAAIMHEPSVLFLDEPTSGVDPLARRAFWQIINSLADRGVAILVTTHYLEEAEHCNRLGIMVDGKLLAQDTPTSLKNGQTGHQIELLTDHPQRALTLLRETMGRGRVSVFGDRMRLTLDDSVEAGVERISKLLSGSGIRIIKVYEQPYSLEDVFIAEVEKTRMPARTP
jgi:ABC-2 type transport system ATP-binding protein